MSAREFEFGRVYGTTGGDVAVRPVAYAERWEADLVAVVDEVRGTDHYEHPTHGRAAADRAHVVIEGAAGDWRDECRVDELVPIADDAWCRGCGTVGCKRVH